MATQSWTIGSASSADVKVNASTVSRRHCLLEQRNDGFYLRDLESTNGTFVNGRRLAKEEVVKVEPDERITLGSEVPMPWPAARPRVQPGGAPRETLSRVPMAMFFGGAGKLGGSLENLFAVGVGNNVMRVAEIPYGWPRARAAWMVLFLLAAIATALRVGIGLFGNANLIPGLIVFASFAVPVAGVVFFLEMNSPRNISLYRLIQAFLIGGALSLLTTLSFYKLIDVAGIAGTMAAAAAEECGKAAVLVWFLHQSRYRWQINGIVLGAAVGAGFAAFETAGYAFVFPLKTLLSQNPAGFVATMDQIILGRSLFEPVTHMAWTALVGAALWKARAGKPFEWTMLANAEVLRALAVVVVLHTVWNTRFDMDVAWTSYPKQLLLGIIVWALIFDSMKESYREIEAVKRSGSA